MDRASGIAQCEAHCSWIDEIAAFKGQTDVDMIPRLSVLFGSFVGSFPPFRWAILCPVSGFHRSVVDVGKAAGVPVHVNGTPGNQERLQGCGCILTVAWFNMQLSWMRLGPTFVACASAAVFPVAGADLQGHVNQSQSQKTASHLGRQAQSQDAQFAKRRYSQQTCPTYIS